MKKKFINGLLMAALFVGFTGSVVSCKDYDDEKVGNLEGLLLDKEASLRSALEAQKTALEAQIADLKTKQQECAENCAKVQQELDSKFNQYVTLTKLNQFKDELGNIYYTKDEVYNKDQVYSKSQIDLLFTEYYTKAQVDAKLKALEDEIKALTDKAAVSNTVAGLLRDGDATLTAALEKYLRGSEFATSIANDFLKVNAAISDAKALAQQALDLANANGIRINGLENSVAALENSVAKLRTDLTKAQADASQALADAASNLKLIKELQDQYAALSKKLNTVEGDVDGLKTKMTNAENSIKALEDKVAADEQAAAEAHEKFEKSIEGLQADVKNIGDLIAAIDLTLTDLQTQIDAANVAIAANKTALQNLLTNVLAKYISGVEINGTYNQLFGTISTPFEMRSNVLVAFNGSIDGMGLEFPTRSPRYYALPDAQQNKLITDEDIEMIGALNTVEGYIRDRVGSRNIVSMDGAEGNAGKIYLTINPTDVNFEGTQFSLINSQDKESLIKIGTPKKSDKVLTFGYTRAEGNGFYEIPATLSVDDIKDVDVVDVQLSEVKDMINQLKGFRNGATNLTGLATTVYSWISDMLEANAVKATWTDEIGQKSFVSQYALAATTIQPLSFSFAKDVHIDHVPGLGRVNDFIDRTVANVFEAFPFFDNEKFRIDSISLNELTGDFYACIKINLNKRVNTKPVYTTFSFSLPDYYIYDDNGNAYLIHPEHPTITFDYVEQDCAIYITYNIADELKALNKDALHDNYKKILAQLQDYIESVNNLLQDLNSINATSIEDNIASSLTSVLDWANGKFSRFMNPNRMLQPVLLIKVDEGTRILYSSKNYPTTVEGKTLKLFPTTYNAEIVSPAYKKFVAVTDVYKDDRSAKKGDVRCKQILDDLNAQKGMKAVIDGGYDGDYIEFPAVSGYKYEILYSAVDYSGKVVTTKAHVRVK